MFERKIGLGLAAALTLSAGFVAGKAHAQVTTSSDYNHPYGVSSGSENTPVNASLRDANGNLILVDGQFASSAMSQETGLQPMGSLGSSTLTPTTTTSAGASVTSLGAGFGGSSTFGTASAIGNSLNVVTVGNGNTVVVNSQQTNNGNQTATVNVSGH